MRPQPEQLAAEIEKTRADLSATLDAIAEKVSPKRVAKRGTKRVSEAVRGTAASAREAVRPAGAVRAGGAVRTAVVVPRDGVPPEADGEPNLALAAAATGATTTVLGSPVHDPAGADGPGAPRHLKQAAADRLVHLKQSVAKQSLSGGRGRSLSEPGSSSATLTTPLAIGAVVAAGVGLLLLLRRRRCR
jgi:MYXO-CTERM domain-containing protein